MTAQQPLKATERLQALQGYNILEAPPEVIFDDLTRMVARACDTPFAVISLIGDDRQWFKSRVGLSAGDSALDEKALDNSICLHAMNEPEVLVVSDTLKDTRFCKHPGVVGWPRIRFFAGAPLRTPEGVAIGSVCVLDNRPRNLSREQQDSLLIVARQVMAQLELRKRREPIVGETTELVEERTRELEASNRRLQLEMEERKQAEEALRQAQKMEAIGQLTGGVAHDFNNLLQVIGANLQLLDAAITDEQIRDRLQAASGAVERGAKLSSQLLAFARRQPLEPCSTNLGRRLRDMDELLHRTLGAEIALRIVIDSSLWNTFVDPVQVENVILNLALNARDAMPGGGNLTIEAANARVAREDEQLEGGLASGEYVMLTITDTGCGMPPDLIDRAFEPFFTTKEAGRGTGLGLSQVYGFIKQSNGHIDISSEVRRGTTVRLYLPRANQAEQPNFEDATSGPVEKGTETILVAEDNPDVREATVALLGNLDYTVLEAVDGEDALAVLQRHRGVDLLFSDVVMPGPVKSPLLAEEAKRLQPDIAVLFTSGYTQDAIVHDGRLDPGVDLLSKPYTREQMARKIRHSLRNREQRLTARQEQQGPGVQQEGRAATRRVLMVEDDPEVLQLISVLVKELGHQVVEFTNAEQALSELKRQHFDVLFTDVGLPDMSGLELARRALARQGELQVIFASGYGDSLTTDDLPSEHITTLTKPYNLADIERVLQ